MDFSERPRPPLAIRAHRIAHIAPAFFSISLSRPFSPFQTRRAAAAAATAGEDGGATAQARRTPAMGKARAATPAEASDATTESDRPPAEAAPLPAAAANGPGGAGPSKDPLDPAFLHALAVGGVPAATNPDQIQSLTRRLKAVSEGTPVCARSGVRFGRASLGGGAHGRGGWTPVDWAVHQSLSARSGAGGLPRRRSGGSSGGCVHTRFPMGLRARARARPLRLTAPGPLSSSSPLPDHRPGRLAAHGPGHPAQDPGPAA
jgi:hypothetical protein